jgi:hypothetical protein
VRGFTPVQRSPVNSIDDCEVVNGHLVACAFLSWPMLIK